MRAREGVGVIRHNYLLCMLGHIHDIKIVIDILLIKFYLLWIMFSLSQAFYVHKYFTTTKTSLSSYKISSSMLYLWEDCDFWVEYEKNQEGKNVRMLFSQVHKWIQTTIFLTNFTWKQATNLRRDCAYYYACTISTLSFEHVMECQFCLLTYVLLHSLSQCFIQYIKEYA